MNDFNVLSGIQSHVREKLPQQEIYLTLPPGAAFPCAVLVMEKIESHGRPSSICGKITFRIDCFSKSVGEAENSHQSAEINAVIDGVSVPLIDGNLAIIRYRGTVREVSAATGKKMMKHFYEALVRRANHG